MRITMKTLYAGPERSVQPGHSVDLPDEEAQALLDGGYAVPDGEDPVDGVAPVSVRSEPAKKAASAKKTAPAKKTGGE